MIMKMDAIANVVPSIPTVMIQQQIYTDATAGRLPAAKMRNVSIRRGPPMNGFVIRQRMTTMMDVTATAAHWIRIAMIQVKLFMDAPKEVWGAAKKAAVSLLHLPLLPNGPAAHIFTIGKMDVIAIVVRPILTASLLTKSSTGVSKTH